MFATTRRSLFCESVILEWHTVVVVMVVVVVVVGEGVTFTTEAVY